MIWAIAVRNLLQHKTKTMIIGLLVSVGIMLTFAGNSFIDSMIRNISGIFTEYYTGDILITSSETLGAGVFGAQSDDVYGVPTIPVLGDYDRVRAKIDALPGVRAVTTQLSGYALFNLEEKGMDFSLFFGVEPDTYFTAMDGIELVQGRLLAPGEEGMLLEYDKWKEFKDQKDIEIRIGDTLQLNNFGTGGFKIREVPVVGIFKFPRGNERLWPMSFLDARSLRYLLGKSGGTVEKVEVSKEATALLDSDFDSLFADDALASAASTAGQVTGANVFDILGDAKPASGAVASTATADVSWHFILVRLDKGVKAAPIIKKLNAEFEDEGLMVKAQSWWESAMPDSLTYTGLQLLFNAAIFILAFVAIIIIMNTMVVSVMERTSEIGTMRALGAQKSFVTKMFIAETGFITLVFGGIGLLLGGLIIWIINMVGIPTDNDALRYLGGGGILRPTIGWGPLVISLCLMAVIALFSWIYPVMIALKVSPLKAIATE